MINQLDDVGRTTDSFLAIALDFMHLARIYINPYREFRPAEVEVMDGFEVQITFLKNLLLFAMKAGVEPDQLRNLLLCIQPLAIIAARVFITDGVDDKDSFEVVRSKCSEVNRRATDPQLYQAFSQALKTSKLSSGKTLMVYDDGGDDTLDIFKNFVDSMTSLLWNVLRLGADPSKQFKGLFERLVSMRSVLKEMGEKFDDKMKDQIGGMICDAGVFTFSLYQIDAEDSDPMLSVLLGKFDVFQTAFENVVSEIPVSSSSKGTEWDSDGDDLDTAGHEKEEVHKEATISRLQPSQSTPRAVDFQDDEVNPVRDRLIRGSKQLRIVPISGMAGIGKTTFALKLYNHPNVVYHFHSRVRCTISQVMDKKKVLCSLLNQSQSGNHSSHSRSENHSEMTEDDLANKLRQSLKRKRYLILLDDVWSPEVLDSLRASFPDDSTGSRIILTSRHRGLTPGLQDEQPHLLRLRKDNECLEILGMKLSDKEGWNPELGMQIAKLCKGLPMTVVIVAGLLVTTRKQDWNGILDSLSSGSVSRSEQCKSALELSYKHMPDYLKPCFLYFGAFPEDQEVSVRKMSTLWIAEGFVRATESRRSQDDARQYLDELIERSLVMVARNRSIGGVKTFRIHDLLHDFYRTKAKEESLFHLLLQRHDQLSDFKEPRSLLRLSIHSDPMHLKKSRLFCPSAHSMLLFYSEKSHDNPSDVDMISILQIFKLLEVLHIDSDIRLANGIPGEIELLTQLTYLSVYSDKAVIPASLGKLTNLETFIAEFKTDRAISFPHTLWDLQELKYLHIECSIYGFTLPITNLGSSPSLLKLETICGVVFYADGSMERQMKEFPNIRRLKCSILPGAESSVKGNVIVIPHFLCVLESLSIWGIRGKIKFGTIQNLRKVTLKEFEFSREDIAIIGKFPNLEVLKFENMFFEGDELEMDEGEFLKLKYLKLGDWRNLKRWKASDDQLPCLQKLILSWCRDLEEIPSDCLENSTTLEEIEVYHCSSAVEASVADIEQAQTDVDYSIKVHVTQSQESKVRFVQTH